jgi:hypothetical protein
MNNCRIHELEETLKQSSMGSEIQALPLTILSPKGTAKYVSHYFFLAIPETPGGVHMIETLLQEFQLASPSPFFSDGETEIQGHPASQTPSPVPHPHCDWPLLAFLFLINTAMVDSEFTFN